MAVGAYGRRDTFMVHCRYGDKYQIKILIFVTFLDAWIHANADRSLDLKFTEGDVGLVDSTLCHMSK